MPRTGAIEAGDGKAMSPLSFPEEFLLLIFDEENGSSLPLPPDILSLALSGSVLMELELAGRVDVNIDQLFAVDSTPTGDDLLDPTLSAVASDSEIRSVYYWIDHGMRDSERIRQLAIKRLINRGILESDYGDSLWLPIQHANSHYYRVGELGSLKELRLRIVDLLGGTDVPKPRDLVTVCLAEACGILESFLAKVLTREEIDDASDRAKLLLRMDLIGSAVVRIAETIRQRPAMTQPCPRAKGIPILGNAIGMARDVQSFMLDQYRKIGPVFSAKGLFRRYVILAGTEANVFVTRHGHHLLTTAPIWDGFVNRSGASRVINGMHGHDHFRMRRHWGQGLSHRSMGRSLAQVLPETRRQITAWPENTRLRGFYSLQRIICSQLGVISCGMPPGEYTDDLIIYLRRTVMTYVLRQRPFLLRTPRFRRAESRIREFAEKVTASHNVPRRREHHCFVEEMQTLRRTDSVLLPEIDWELTVIAPFLSGLDLSAATCSFMLYALLRHPDLMERVRAEADGLFSNGEPTAAQVRRMDVTRRVLMETLRMYPPSPCIQRVVTNSFDFGGYKIQAGQTVLIGCSVPHFLQEYFPEPDRFDIDRYLPERAEHKQLGAYAPFGMGAHRCMGQGIAEVQIALTVAMMLHLLEIELAPAKYELRTKREVVVRPDERFKFKVARRR